MAAVVVVVVGIVYGDVVGCSVGGVGDVGVVVGVFGGVVVNNDCCCRLGFCL